MAAALDGVRVLDLSRFVAGPYCAMLLGDLGADVVKVEKLDGDSARKLNPQAPAGLQLVRDLAATADIIVENFRPGTMEKMGLGFDVLSKLNPRLIMVRISGFGQRGPDAQAPCFDVIAQARSGIMDLTGDPDGPPTTAGVFVCDYGTGMYATIGALAALRARETTGRGQVVEASLMDTGISFLMTAIPEQILLGQTTKRIGNRDRYSAPSNVFRSADGDWIHIAGGQSAMFPRLTKAIGRPDLVDNPKFATSAARMQNVEEIEKIVADWVVVRGTADALHALGAADVTCAKVATMQDVVADPQLRSQGKIVDVMHEDVGVIPMQGLTIQMSDTPLSIRSGLPRVGAHRDAIVERWLGVAGSSDRVSAVG